MIDFIQTARDLLLAGSVSKAGSPECSDAASPFFVVLNANEAQPCPGNPAARL